MSYAYLFLVVFLAIMIFVYFVPYKTLKGKVFNRLIWREPAKLFLIGFRTSTYTIKLERVSLSHWMYFFPDRWDANDSKVRHLIMELSEVKVVKRFKVKKSYDEYEIGRYGELELQYSNETIFLSIGSKSEDGDLVYVKISNDDDVLGVPAVFITAIPKTADDFKDMLLFNKYYSNVAGLEIRFNDKSFVMDRTDDGWMMNGNHAFNESAKPVIDKLLNSEAKSFAKDVARLPAKAVGSIIIKLNSDELPITRFFFEDDIYPDDFLVPANSKILIVSKTIIDTFNLA